jgi:hypothetical protein
VGRALAIAGAVLFLISWIFPVAAGLSSDIASFPRWWGAVDVSIAGVVALAAFAVQALIGGKVSEHADRASYRIYRILIHGILVGGFAGIVAGDHIHWARCATGFAWRVWLLLYMLPAWLTALSTGPSATSPVLNR